MKRPNNELLFLLWNKVSQKNVIWEEHSRILMSSCGLDVCTAFRAYTGAMDIRIEVIQADNFIAFYWNKCSKYKKKLKFLICKRMKIWFFFLLEIYFS